MSVKQHESAVEDDDIFHCVTMSEETSWQNGYAEGIEEGKTKGYTEGFALGTEKGTDIGKEVGFYAGYAAYFCRLKQTGDPKSRIIRVCEAIIKLADSFEDVEPTDESLTDNLNQIRGKFKQLSSLIGVQVEYNTVSGDDVKGSSF